ncbi:hypothetical protein [Janthinobacterium sp. LB3P118]|uniref:hypothetical protein n=1 Tax=Janthinobacterium sp. LB3P118 TaxID=3424195 RepID=UPI003F1E8777
MLQRWIRLPYRLSILARLAAGAIATLHTVPILTDDTPATLMAACDILLGAMALLLWRRHRLALRRQTLE